MAAVKWIAWQVDYYLRINMDLISKFQALSRASNISNAQKPFTVGEHTYATNGNIIVRAKSLDVGKADDKPAAVSLSKIPWADLQVEEGTWLEVTVKDNAPIARTGARMTLQNWDLDAYTAAVAAKLFGGGKFLLKAPSAAKAAQPLAIKFLGSNVEGFIMAEPTFG